VNTALLAVGAVLANVLGTTGASMLLIRPLLRANAARKARGHSVIFFIFLVSNMGGLLLPIGDPPLFLGYLRGVPFSWTLQLWDVWLTGVIAVLVVFYVVDTVLAQREIREGAAVSERAVARADRAVRATAEQPDEYPRIRISGGLNVLLLMGVVWATAALVPGTTLHWTEWEVPVGARELVLVACAATSMMCSPRQVRVENRFTMGPILEVAALFSGLFVAMQPALQLLAARGDDLGFSTPAQFFWATGSLSSFLDNAPTYLVFANVGMLVSQPGVQDSVTFGGGTIDGALLAAISCGAVFMGAMTYIGNGPNLMVAAIAREDGVRMPSFFGYMAWSAAVLLPILAFVAIVFFG
jgi:Na+/H+ antiporter NhaD/arsenite permease-like protein